MEIATHLRLRISSPVPPTKAPTSPSNTSQVAGASRSSQSQVIAVLFACTKLS